ncbi:hypothetical protein RJ639_015655 [Escallonia herrerae]|uniref:C2H2-type domain-containing protein n=1 Tax=Escallonia herrerae TaxID=1293975 RepID=A0AA89AKF5_9ASTE|nr:hypothetical protein RJ639_015655 [Escallonia herrerae]
MMTMKRTRDDVEKMAMENCMMLLSRVGKAATTPSLGRLFECKTCNRQFQSFQALGGHRASHKKPRLMALDLLLQVDSPAKPKTHECSICGLEFAIGQALGGHMRRHRSAATAAMSEPSPVLKRSGSRKRVLCLDLSLKPYEYDLDQLGKTSSIW